MNETQFKLIDGFLWGKCIKTKIIRRALKLVGFSVYNQKINYGGDRIINFFLFKVANSFKFIQEEGIIYNLNNKSITHLNYYIKDCHDELINLKSIYNFTKNTREVEVVSYEIVDRWNTIIFPGLDRDNYKCIKRLIRKLLLNKYTNKYDKNKLMILSHNLSKINLIKIFKHPAYSKK